MVERVNSKVLVFGEYSVLHNSMALTLPYRRFSGELCFPKDATEKAFTVLSNEGIRKFCKYIIATHTDETFKLNVQQLSKELDSGLFFRSNIPQGFGLGSSGALVAAVFLRYLEKAGKYKDELRSLTMEKAHHLKTCLGGLEGFFHGKSSGIDPFSILVNKPLLLKENKEIVEANIPIYNEKGNNTIFLLNTGIARNSEHLIHRFNEDCKQADFLQKLNKQLIQYTNGGINNFLQENTALFYHNIKQLVAFQLEELNYLIPKHYQKDIEEGIKSDAYYLKICGSGGGGYMIGFTQNWEETQQRLQKEKLEILYRF